MPHNWFLGLGYLSHDISFLILLWAIFSNKSAEGNEFRVFVVILCLLR